MDGKRTWGTSPKPIRLCRLHDLTAFNNNGPLNHTLGFLNNPFGPPSTTPATWAIRGQSSVPLADVEQPAVRQPVGVDAGAVAAFVEIAGRTYKYWHKPDTGRDNALHEPVTCRFRT